MATIKSLVNRIETRLFLVAGIDVQTHAEDQIIEMIRSNYNILFEDFWYPEHTLYMDATLNGTTGEVTTDLTNVIRRYADIHSVYWDEEETPVPRMSPMSNRGRVRTRSIGPSGNPQSVFKFFPNDETGPVHIWYRTRLADSVWENYQYDTDINLDDELLLISCVYEFLTIDESNDRAAQEQLTRREQRKQQIRDQQWQIPLSKSKLDRDGPLSRWE